MENLENEKPKDQEIEFLFKEMEHTVSQRSDMWKSYIYFLKSYFVLITLPFPLGAAILRIFGKVDIGTNPLPEFIYWVSLFIGVLSFIYLFILINMRMDVLLFSRSINGLRGFIAKKLNIELDPSITLLPDSCDAPKYYEISKVMGILVNIGSLLSSFYILLFLSFCIGPCFNFLTVIVVTILLLLIANLAYFYIAKYRIHIIGAEKYYLKKNDK